MRPNPDPIANINGTGESNTLRIVLQYWEKSTSINGQRVRDQGCFLGLCAVSFGTNYHQVTKSLKKSTFSQFDLVRQPLSKLVPTRIPPDQDWNQWVLRTEDADLHLKVKALRWSVQQSKKISLPFNVSIFRCSTITLKRPVSLSACWDMLAKCVGALLGISHFLLVKWKN